jgi:hypothetical protein
VLRYVLAALLLLLSVPLALAGITSQPDPKQGKVLAEKLCTNCHLVGGAVRQEHANADVPSFPEIANLEGQTAGDRAHHAAQASHAYDPLDQGRACRSCRLHSQPARRREAVNLTGGVLR